MVRLISQRIHLVWILIQLVVAPGWLRAQDDGGASVVRVDVGGQPLLLPIPEGFVVATGVDQMWDEFATAFTAPGNRMLATFVTQADHTRLEDGNTPELRRLLHVQIMRSLENESISLQRFADEKSKVREEINLLQQSGSDPIADQLKSGSAAIAAAAATIAPGLALSASETRVIKIFGETESALGFIIGSKLSVDGNEMPMITAARLALVSGRMLALYAVSEHQSSMDIEWAVNTVTHWSDQTMVTATAPEGNIPERAIDNMGIGPVQIVSIVGLLSALVIWLFTRKRRKNRKRHINEA